MLAALEQGVKGGKWYSLIDKLHSEATLRAAFTQVEANRGAAGVDHVTVEQYAKDMDANLGRLSEALRTGSYRPQQIRRHYIPKPGSQEMRPLGIPTVRDRVVQTALRMVMEPIYEKDFAAHSYGFRPGRGCKDALRRVAGLLAAGYVHIVDADLKSYFDTIPKDRLKALIGRKVTDGRILALITSFLEQGVLDGAQEWTPEQGTPQGAVVSPLLSNIYLDPLDHLMAGRGFEMVRYADDFVVMCRSEEDAAAALAVVQQWTAQAGLTLHPTKTRLVDEREHGFDFLGYHFEAGKRWPRSKSRKKLRDTIRAKTKRTSGHSMTQIVADVNRTLRGWFEYFKHSLQPTFRMEDGFVRRRLRSILRKRSHRKGSAKASGADHTRWTNAYFAKLGLFSLQHAHAAVGQPSCR
ncbi:MAG: group II intron reverse transcriptase/maturase [Fimbriimonadales bacterium]